MRPPEQFSRFSKKVLLFLKKLFDKKYSAPNLWWKQVIFIFGIRWFFGKNRQFSKNFSAPFSQKVSRFSKKRLIKKIFGTLFPVTNFIFTFAFRRIIPFKRSWLSKTVIGPFLEKYCILRKIRKKHPDKNGFFFFSNYFSNYFNTTGSAATLANVLTCRKSFAPVNLYFHFPKYRFSDTLFAPKIFSYAKLYLAYHIFLPNFVNFFS